MHTTNPTSTITSTTPNGISPRTGLTAARRMTKLTVASIALALGLTACGPTGPAAVSVDLDARSASSAPANPSADAAAVTQTTQTTQASGAPVDEEPGADVDHAGPTDIAPAPTTPDTAPNPSAGAATDLAPNQVPGEALDYGPAFGTPLVVVGVAYDDVLNFRIAPSPNAQIVESHAPLHADLDMYALGEAWAAPTGVWWKVSVGGDEAWANQRYLGTLAAERDLFDAAAEYLQILMFEDTESAALAVAEAFGTTEPQSRIEFAAPALNFDDGVGVATIDVLDIGDDSVKGWRLGIQVEIVWDEESGEPGAQDVAFVVLTAVDGSPICGRGSDGFACL